MKELKREKISEIIHRAAAEYVRNEASPSSLLTITRVTMNESGKAANIYFTTLPTEQQETALKFLERKLPEFKMFLRDHSSIGFLPHLNFHIDFGERNRQRLDEISLD